MSCKTITFDGANDAERCKCRAAVLRAYRELLSAGCPVNFALDAAKTVYAYHHPEDTKLDAGLTVERWICASNEQFH